MSDKLLPILKIKENSLPEDVIVCGDPGRVDKFAQIMDEVDELAYNREYKVIEGKYSDVSVAVVSHGVGAAGAAICFEELIKAGAKRLIRVGTAGSLNPNIQDGDLVIASGAVREDGVTDQLVPLSYPALADADILKALQKAAAEEKDINTHTGPVVSLGAFYPGLLDLPNSLMSKANAKAVEMECSSLFVVAGLRSVKAGAVVAIDGMAVEFAADEYDPHREEVDKAIKAEAEIALRAVEILNIN